MTTLAGHCERAPFAARELGSLGAWLLLLSFSLIGAGQAFAATPTALPRKLPPKLGAPVVNAESGQPPAPAGSSVVEAPLARPSQPMATLELEWEVVEEAMGYEVKLVPTKGGPAITLQSSENRLKERVPPGAYQLQIRSKDKRSGYFGTWSAPARIEVEQKTVELLEPREGEVIANAKAFRVPVKFQWLPIADARYYTMKLWSDDPEKAQEFRVMGISKTLNLLSGKVYHWQVTHTAKKGVSYRAAADAHAFTLLGPQLLTPVVDKNVGLPHVVKASWAASPGARRYEARILRRHLDEANWFVHKSDVALEGMSWEFPRLSPGAYRIEVIAHAPNRVSSEAGFYEFVVKPTEAELDQALTGALRMIEK